jgi:hypothetical protein
MTMNTKSNSSIIHKILMIFVAINIIGDIGNVIGWLAIPDMRGSLTGGVMNGVEMSGGYIAVTAGADAALMAGAVILTAVAIIYIVALFGLLKGRKWSPLLIIAISIVNRVLAVLLFELNIAFAFWGIWTVILVVVAFLDHRKLKA